MARRAAFVAEASDSDDAARSSDDEQPRAAPTFVRAHQAEDGVRTMPSFVRAATSAPDPTESSSDVAFVRRTAGAGLGAPPVPGAVEDGHDVQDDRSLAATPAREQGAGLGAPHVQARAKVPHPPPAPTPPPATPLSRTSGSGGFDPSAYLRQMGWTGGGLGKQGEGMVDPIQVQLRPARAGVAFGGRREKTQQERAEERRRTGRPSSSDEEAEAAPAAAPVSVAWKRQPRERKPAVVYRTYEEIVAEAATPTPTAAPVLDATGGTLREVDSVAAALAKHPVPTSDSTQLPELRHNVRLLCESSRATLQKLARDGAAHLDRARWLDRDVHEAARRVAQCDAERGVLASVLSAVTRLSATAQQAARLEDLAPDVEVLLRAQTPATAPLGLDEAVAGALVPVLRRALQAWDPLQAPHAFTPLLAQWRPILRPAHAPSDVMTPYESVLWNVWMPKIRSTLTGAWDVHDPASGIALVEAWRDLLPPFLLDNLLEQLVLPKLQRAVHQWTPRSRVPLHVLLLPWLPLAEKRMDVLLVEARQQWRSALTAWRVSDGLPPELVHWKAVFPARDWEALLLEKVVPALSRALKTEFVINPAAQELGTLEQVLAWRGLLRESVFSRLLETEFGTPFLLTLHRWLTQPAVRLDEVAAWYTFWRQWLPPDVVQLAGVASVLMRALRLMNHALDLGVHRRSLPVPDTHPTSRATSQALPRATPAAPPPTLEDVAFRTVVEERARERDLFVLPLNRLEPTTGLGLLCIAPHIDRKGGVSFYIDDDVVFAAVHDTYEPISVAALLDRAQART